MHVYFQIKKQNKTIEHFILWVESDVLVKLEAVLTMKVSPGPLWKTGK